MTLDRARRVVATVAVPPQLDAEAVQRHVVHVVLDDLFLHRTALDPSMTHTRHAIESWFFAPSCYPEGHVPLVW